MNLTKPFERLVKNIDDTRAAINDRIRNDNVLSSQKPVLQEVDSRLLDLHDQLISILTVWNITDAKNKENEDMLQGAVDDLGDTGTLIGGTSVFMLEPAGIKYILANATKRNAKIAINLLSNEIRKQWCEWLGCNE